MVTLMLCGLALLVIGAISLLLGTTFGVAWLALGAAFIVTALVNRRRTERRS